MKLTRLMLLPFLQVCLVIAALIVDHATFQGHGEGRNQIVANLLTNVEFLLKIGLGFDDIVNYNFRPLTFALGLLFWFIVGLCLQLPKTLKKFN